jgi:hypothetical protein
MRAPVLGIALVLFPAAAFAETDIAALCYDACEASTHSNPEFKACVARAPTRPMQP